MMDDYDILPRIGHFNDLMEPAAHLFPAGFTQDLKANGFFTAPASTKYHGAFEGVLSHLTSLGCSMICAKLTFTGIHTQRRFCTLGTPKVTRLSARRI